MGYQAIPAEGAKAHPITVEVLGSEQLFAVGTVPSRHVPRSATGEVDGVYVLVRYRAGRVLSVICQSVGEARKLPGFRPLPRGEARFEDRQIGSAEYPPRTFLTADKIIE